MSEQHTDHRVTVAAPVAVIYDLVADVGCWPVVFPPTVHAEQIERSGDGERIRIWATANDEVKNWTSRRILDRAARSITFRQDRPAHPVAAMSGEWRFEPAGPDKTVVRLLHTYRAVDDDPGHLDWIRRAVDRNSEAELSALAAAAGRDDELLLSFEDAVSINGRAADAYTVIDEAGLWPQRLPHVARVVLDERVRGVQSLAMDTRTADGSVHTTVSIRICLPPDRIVYKQLQTPKLMSAHTGFWSFREHNGDTEMVAGHTVVINESAIAGVLGEDATVADARSYIRAALGRNSGTTMRHAKAYAEQARRG
ncbi:aromatase/cyclase [Micromonospora aurantiaca (nom. illeg.)]|uniref:aromatase/cyclase n=1 Tax=Micromonospora aurantiaca (nom. illeg.) TaxID=47850 RepID=UPI00082791B5|nr:aromatase/cyclase [Micromonospora aurantiaca]RNH89996.1 cyclase [Micromonospora aurantiaca]SCL43572.1 aromatase [Micromonospora aurantiaca]